jgi:hypothetical protein
MAVSPVFCEFQKVSGENSCRTGRLFSVCGKKCECTDEELFWISLRIEKPFSKLPCLSSRANTNVVRAEIDSSPYECKVAAWLSALSSWARHTGSAACADNFAGDSACRVSARSAAVTRQSVAEVHSSWPWAAEGK